MRGDRSRGQRVYPLLALVVIGAALALRAPVLRTGFTVDDYAQLSMLTGAYPVPRSPLALFTFSDGSAREVTALRDAGFFPWWSEPGLRVSLFRPLSSALTWCDLRLFGDDAFAYHLHSACWWLATMALLAAVLRRVLPPFPAILALVLIAAHPGHIMFLGWIANRNATIAATFALLGLLGQLAGSGAERRSARVLIYLSYALALCASEYALAFLPYAVLYDLEHRGASGPRFRRLAPWLALVSFYGLLRVVGGFGARGSGMYLDPFADPMVFLRAACARLPVLVGDLVLAVRSTWYSAGFPWAPRFAERGWLPAAWALDLRPLRTVQVALGVAALPILAAFVAWGLRRPVERASRTRFLVLGLPLSLLPALSAFPESRLLLPGLLAWSALLMDAAWSAWCAFRARQGAARARLALVATGGLWLLGVVLPPLYARSETEGMAPLANAVRASILAPSLDPVLGGRRHALLIAAVDPTTTIYVPLVRRFHGRPAPEGCQLLMSTASPLRLSRVASNSVAVERLQGEYSAADAYASAFNQMPLQVGQRFVSDGMQVTVERVQEGRPMRARYELDQSLDDPSVVLLMQTVFGLSVVPPPPIGESIVLPPALPPFALMTPPA